MNFLAGRQSFIIFCRKSFKRLISLIVIVLIDLAAVERLFSTHSVDDALEADAAFALLDSQPSEKDQEAHCINKGDPFVDDVDVDVSEVNVGVIMQAEELVYSVYVVCDRLVGVEDEKEHDVCSEALFLE
jgi:hypothetical protein